MSFTERLAYATAEGPSSYTYLGKDGTADKPAFRIELSGSGSQVDYFNNQSPMLYGVRGKVLRSTRAPTRSTRAGPRRWATRMVAKARLKSRSATVF